MENRTFNDALTTSSCLHQESGERQESSSSSSWWQWSESWLSSCQSTRMSTIEHTCKERHDRIGRPVVSAVFSQNLRRVDFQDFLRFVAVRSFTADSGLLQHTVQFSQWITCTRMAQVGVRTHSITSHVSCALCERCSWSLRQFHSFLLIPHVLSDHLVLPSASQLHLPGCGGQIPCALPLRTLAPWPRTSLPQVVSPTSTTSRRLMSTSPRNPRWSSGSPMTSTTMRQFISITIWFTNLFLCFKVWKFPQQRQQWTRNGKNRRKFRRWNLTKVRSKKDVIDEARTTGTKVHFASLMDICHLENAYWRQSTKNTKAEL